MGLISSIILHDMFLHAAEQGWKEAELFVWWAASRVYQGQTQRQTHPPLNLWSTGPPTKRSETSTTAYICWEGHLGHCLVGPNGERRQSKTSCPLWGVGCIGEVTPPPPRKMHEGRLWPLPFWPANWNPSLGLGGGKTHTMRSSKRPERLTNEHWRLPTCWNMTLRG